MKKLFALFLFVFSLLTAQAQYVLSGQDTLLCNEWIDFNQTYLKIKVAEDGIYRVGKQALSNAGVDIGQVDGDKFQVWHNGKQVPIYTSTNAVFGDNDYLEFFGKKNTSELDRFLFSDPDSMMMNPMYSLVTDSAAYFLTWVNTVGNLRYETVNNDLTNLPLKEEYYFAELLNNSFSACAKKTVGEGVTASNYDYAEGFASNLANISNFTLSPTAIYSGAVDGSVYLRFTGNSGEHDQVVSLNGQPIVTSNFNGFEVQQETIPIPNNQLSGTMNFKFQGMVSGNDKHRVANIVLTYPRQFNFENKTSYFFALNADSEVNYLEISNFNSTSGLPILYDLTNENRIVGVFENGVIKLAIPPSATKRELVLVNSAIGSLPVNNLKNIDFFDYGQMNHDYVIVTGQQLLNDGAGNNRVQEYADYRASQAGGSFNPIIVTAEQLYDQFSWGIERHPFSVRNFAHFVKRNWSDAAYFLILGKGREYADTRSQVQLQEALVLGYYVPTFSFPGADNLLLAGPDGYTPVLPLGRIAATKPAEILTYLNKIKEFEANRNLPQNITERAWMKNIINLGGGNGASPSEQQLLRSNLENMATILANGKMGATAKGFYKTSTDPIQQPQTTAIFEYINSGLSIMTFFGHSAVGVFDFSIDFPDNWKNKGKYPWMVSLGCYAGNIHTKDAGIGQRFLFLEDAGTIAFSATSGQGYIDALNTFTVKLYDELGSDSYGAGLGNLIQKNISQFQSNNFGINLIRQQFNLLGDPAIKVNSFPGPDYLVDESTVTFNPTQVNAAQENFSLSFDIVNIGLNKQDSIRLKVEHQLPNASRIIVVDTLVPAPYYRTAFEFKIPVPKENSVGLNRFFIKADASDRVEELPLPQAENNNELVMSNGELGALLFIRDNSAIPAYPTEFGIVGPNAVTLKAFTTDPLAPSRKYVLQIDTTELFNSQLLQVKEVVQSGGVIRWAPTINWQDETVYYWRITPDSISPQEGFNWNASSFLFKNDGTEGWNQSHFYQFKKDDFVNLKLEGHDNLNFIDDFKGYRIESSAQSVKPLSVLVNNVVRGTYWGTPSAIYVMWLDSVNKEPRINYYPGSGPTSYGIPNPYGQQQTRQFIFLPDSQDGRKSLMEFIQDVIPNGDYVVLFTVQGTPSTSYKPEEWAADSLQFGRNLFQVLEADGGAQKIRQLEATGSVPYAIAYRKGMGVVEELRADNNLGTVLLEFSLDGNWFEGSLNSTLIGPSAKWNQLVWQTESDNHPEADTVNADIYGVRQNLFDTLLYSGVLPNSFDLSNVSAVDFPYLKLKMNSKDSLFRTPANLNYWRVIYQGVPEFAFDPSGEFNLQSDTIQAGQPLVLKYAVENLSANDGDSLLVKYAISDASNNQNLIFRELPALVANDTVHAQITFDTRNNKGRQNLLIELNPANDQPESTHINNFLQTNFFVMSDLRNPLLDVTFDGVQILDGELVSPKPLIRISLKDENKYLLLSDTSRFKLFLLYPDSVQPTPISLNSQNLVFTPASSNADNRATIEFEPIFTSDGKYALIVQSSDVTGNSAGVFDFKRSFQVITKTSISNFVNYPNPFTNATRFLYTMTGSEVPARYKLQIMTVSGRIVREVGEQELGALKAGTHLTDFVWDGKDEYGDQLANGVYLYRLVVQDEKGDEWEKHETGTDKYFKAGFGKMVLLR